MNPILPPSTAQEFPKSTAQTVRAAPVRLPGQKRWSSMHAPFGARSGQASSATTFGLRLAVLLLPALLLLIGSLRYHGGAAQVLLFGAAFQMFVCTLGLLTQAFWRQSVGPAVILFYGIAFAWLFLGTDRK